MKLQHPESEVLKSKLSANSFTPFFIFVGDIIRICMKNKKKILIICAVTLFTLLFILPAIAFSVVNWGILPAKKLTPLVVREVNKRIDGRLECDKIELTFFNTYPHLGLKFINGNITSHALKDSIHLTDTIQQADSLLRFGKIILSIRPLDYLSKKQLTIGDILIEEPVFYGYVDSEGNANWNIYSSETKDDDDADTESGLPPIDLQKVKIVDGDFIYDDRQNNLYTHVQGFFLDITGSLIQGGNTFDLRTGSSSLLFESPDYSLENKMAIDFRTQLEIKDNYNSYVLQNAEMKVNDLPFTADGSFTYLEETETIGLNMEVGLKVSDLKDLMQFIPESYLQNKKDIEAKGAVYLEANIYGEVGDSIIPSLDIRCFLENGSFAIKNVSQSIENLELNMDIHLDGQEPQLSHVILDKLQLKGMNTSLDVKGEISNVIQSPYLNGRINGKVDLTRMAEDFIDPDTLLLQGYMDADMEASFALNDLLDGRYNNVKFLGSMNIDSLKAFSSPYGIDMFISGAHFSMDTTKHSSGYIAGDNLLNAALNVDSMRVIYKEDINTLLSGMEITAKTAPTIDTTSVMSVTSHIRVENLRTRLPDSVWVVAKNTYLRGGIKPSDSNKQIPQLLAGITVDSLRYFDLPSRLGASFAKSTFSIEALPYRDAMRQKIAVMRSDSTRRLAANRPAGQRRERSDGSRRRETSADSLSSSGQLLRNWELRGSVSFNQMRLFSRLFPLPMRMEKTKVKFDTNNIQFSDARFHAGNSSFTLTGEINSMRRAMLRGGKLQGNFNVNSDYIDCTELMQTISKGMLYAEQQAENATGMNDEQITSMDDTALMDSISVIATDTADMLFTVPAFLDMSLTMNARKIDYKDLEMTNVDGEVVVRNQSINLKKLNMDSNIGKGNVTMYYKAATPQKATVGFDLEMHQILVEELIDLYPAIDSLLPMLRSFEGVVDCQMATTCDLDSASSVILPSLQTSCYLKGKDMVLLDGETFAEISKTLMFKNKKRNIIENISVDLTIADNKIQVYPFLVEIDRYRVAVGGTHNLDMTFDYHVSVLKSPVPFKLGIDVSGNLDDFKYKIVKCRYKDIFQPAKQHELDPTPANIRRDLRDFIKNQIVENAPELAANSLQ